MHICLTPQKKSQVSFSCRTNHGTCQPNLLSICSFMMYDAHTELSSETERCNASKIINQLQSIVNQKRFFCKNNCFSIFMVLYIYFDSSTCGPDELMKPSGPSCQKALSDLKGETLFKTLKTSPVATEQPNSNV